MEPTAPQPRSLFDTSDEALREILDYISAQIKKAYDEAGPYINRLFAEETRLALGEGGNARALERVRNERSRKIYDLEAATAGLKQEWIRIASAAELVRTSRIVMGADARPAR